MTHQTLRFLIATAGAALVLPGCAVPQKPGKGSVMHLREPQTKAGYWLYLPEDYVRAHKDAKVTSTKYPLVMTFHGMKPFDNARSQIREWQQEADRYNFVVCAPELVAPDVSNPVPLNRITKDVERDEKVILAVMDEVMRTTDVNPSRVLVTSWSYGGYLAHYMLNRHPARFACLAVKQSNFSSDLLDPRLADRYRDRKIAIFYTENDFAICQRESQQAAIWYTKLGFDVTFRELSEKGHERTPSLAAAFFARECGVEPKTVSEELARLQVRDVPVLDRAGGEVAGVIQPAGGGDVAPPPASSSSPGPRPKAIPPVQPKSSQAERTTLASAGFNIYDRQPVYTRSNPQPPPRAPVERKPAEVIFPKPAETATTVRTRPALPESPPKAKPAPPRRTVEPPMSSDIRNPVRVRLSSTIGIAPLLVSYSAAVPNRLKESAYFLWTDNGEPMSNAVNGQKFFTEPGDHEITVLVTTPDGQEFRASSTVTVLERLTRSKAQ